MIRIFLLVHLFSVNLFAQNYLKPDVDQVVESYRLASAASVLKFDFQGLDERPYTIQVASYVAERDALQHAEELRLTEEHVFYYPAFYQGQVWFKVCVGRFDKRERADQYRERFAELRREPFSVTISLNDRPGEDKKALAMMEASNAARSPASINLTKESAKIPVHGVAGTSKKIAQEKVTLIPKAKAKKVTPKTAAVVEVSQSGPPKYAVQVAAFPSATLAEQKKNKLKYPSNEVFFRPAVVNGKTWYRVMVGYFHSHKDAREFQAQYSEQNSGAESIIRKLASQ